MAAGQRKRVLGGFYAWLEGAFLQENPLSACQGPQKTKALATVDASITIHFAGAPASASWGFEASAPAKDFRDQYCARTGQGDLGRALLLSAAEWSRLTRGSLSKPNRF